MSNWPLVAASRFETVGITTGAGTLVTTGAANTKGSYGSLGASSFDWSGFILQIEAGFADRFRLDVAINNGSDVVIVADLYFECSNSTIWSLRVPLPIAVKSGSTLKVRAQAIGISRTLRTAILGYAGDFPMAPGFSRAISLTDFTNTDPTNTITLNGTTQTGWSQIAASSAFDVAAIIAGYTNGGDGTRSATQFSIDIGKGAAAAEQTLMTLHGASGTAQTPGGVIGPLPCHIPAGTRLAARAQASAANSDTLAVGLIGLAA